MWLKKNPPQPSVSLKSPSQCCPGYKLTIQSQKVTSGSIITISSCERIDNGLRVQHDAWTFIWHVCHSFKHGFPSIRLIFRDYYYFRTCTTRFLALERELQSDVYVCKLNNAHGRISCRKDLHLKQMLVLYHLRKTYMLCSLFCQEGKGQEGQIVWRSCEGMKWALSYQTIIQSLKRTYVRPACITELFFK